MYFKNFFNVLLLLAIFTIIFHGCSDDSNPAKTNDDTVIKSLVGEWDIRLVIYNTSEKETKIDPYFVNVYGNLDLSADGTFSYDESVNDSSLSAYGTWTASQGKLTLKSDKGFNIDMLYSLDSDRDYRIPQDTIRKKFDGTYNGQQAIINYIFQKRYEHKIDNALLGNWRFFEMTIAEGDSLRTVTNSGINYTVNYQQSSFRLDSIVLGYTSIFTAEWFVFDDKAVMYNDFEKKVWKYQISNDTLTAKFKNLEVSQNAIFTQKFKKY